MACKSDSYLVNYMILFIMRKHMTSVLRAAMWLVLERFGLTDQFISMIRALHDGMVVRVIHQNDISEEFRITCGLKQGCVLALILFSLYLAAMLYEITYGGGQSTRDLIIERMRREEAEEK